MSTVYGMDPIFSGKCCLIKHNLNADLEVFNSKIIFNCANNTRKEVEFKEVLCCKSNKTKHNLTLTLISYPLVKSKFGKRFTRIRKTICFALLEKPPYENTYDLEEKLNRIISGKDLNDSNEASLQNKPLLVIINPVSGKGKGEKVYEKHVKRMFAEASIEHESITTERVGHAFDIVVELHLDKWRGIILVSGDGLVHEVINGLMNRKDWDLAIKKPIGLVPGGSGNALAASVIYQTTGKHYIDDVTTMSLFEICKGSPIPMDIVSVETMGVKINAGERGKVAYSFLFSAMGLLADCDIESEKLRFLGGDVRDAIYGIMRIATLRKYHAKVSFHRISEEDANNVAAISDLDTATTHKPEELLHTPLLSDDVPQDWESETGNYSQIMASYLSHVAVGKMITGKSKLSDGRMFLHTLGENVTRVDFTRLWGAMEEGVGAEDTVESIKESGATIAMCDIFRVEPSLMHSEILDIDGERFPLGPFQCQINKGLARVFAYQ